MPSLIPGFEYDIFISYRQKDNKYDGWVTEFVNNLKKELEATFKEDINVYFDINPHDGLLESHEVEDSLKTKLKCLIFIPVISRTYCDPKAFAWQNEFLAFIDMASKDQFGLKVKLPNGNVASRILPVRIYDLNKEDVKLCETALGGVLRGIEFIYKSAGVNRPLRANEDHAQDNLNKTYYRDQINKMSHSILEIIQGLRREPGMHSDETSQPGEEVKKTLKEEGRSSRQRNIKLPWKIILTGIITIAILSALLIFYPEISRKEKFSDLSGSAILDKAIQECDPYNNWPDYKGKLHLINVRLDGEILADEILEIKTKERFYYCSTVIKGRTKIVKGINNGKYYRERNDTILSGRDIDTNDIENMMEHHYCHFGLLMELKASGLILEEKAKVTSFHGVNCFALNFTTDTSITKSGYFKNTRWTVYIDTDSFTTKGYSFQNFTGVKGYVTFTGNLLINGISLPMIKTYYSSVDDKFLAVDLLTKAR